MYYSSMDIARNNLPGCLLRRNETWNVRLVFTEKQELPRPSVYVWFALFPYKCQYYCRCSAQGHASQYT